MEKIIKPDQSISPERRNQLISEVKKILNKPGAISVHEVNVSEFKPSEKYKRSSASNSVGKSKNNDL